MDNAGAAIERGGLEGIQQGAQLVLEEANSFIAVDTGAQKGSGKVTVDALSVTATISYGDSSTNPKTGTPTKEYATDLHEYYGRKNPQSYLFLRKAMQNKRDEVFQTIAESIGTELANG